MGAGPPPSIFPTIWIRVQNVVCLKERRALTVPKEKVLLHGVGGASERATWAHLSGAPLLAVLLAQSIE